MAMGERYQQNLEQGVGPLVDGPVVTVTVGSPVGSMSNLFRAEALNAAGAAMGGGDSPQLSGATRGRVRRDGGKDVRLPQSFAVAVTPTSVYFFKWKPFWGRVKIKGELACIPRSDLLVQVAPRKTSTAFLLVSPSTGTRAAFELGTLGFSSAQARVDAMVAALAPETAA
jgi:hypothetical protein